MKKLNAIILAGLILVSAGVLQAEERDYHSGNVSRGGLDIDVWVDNEDGVYYEGESIRVFFHASRDCFVAIYSVDTRGEVNLLYPSEPWDNGFVYGGEVYAVPADYADYELIVTGPEGMEHIQAIASPEEMNIPDWYGGSSLRADYHDDRGEFVDYINRRYFQSRWDDYRRVFDDVTVFVKSPHYYYKPVHVPTSWYDYPHYSMIYIDYPFGAEVYIDGIYFGIAPLWIPRVIVGWRWITIYDRYGYCWEDHIYVHHDNTIRLDRSRVKTSRTFTSRYKDIRKQAKKFNRSNYVLSDKRVKVTRSLDKTRTSLSKDSRYSTKKSTTGKTRRIEDTWNSKRSKSRDIDKSKTRIDKSKGSYRDYRKSGGSSSAKDSYRRGDSRKSTGSSTYRPSRKSTGSSGSKSYRGTSGSRKSSGSSGSKSYRGTSGSKRSSGVKSSSRGSSSSRKSGGISKPSGGSSSSSGKSSGRSSSRGSSSKKSSGGGRK